MHFAGTTLKNAKNKLQTFIHNFIKKIFNHSIIKLIKINEARSILSPYKKNLKTKAIKQNRKLVQVRPT